MNYRYKPNMKKLVKYKVSYFLLSPPLIFEGEKKQKGQ